MSSAVRIVCLFDGSRARKNEPAYRPSVVASGSDKRAIIVGAAEFTQLDRGGLLTQNWSSRNGGLCGRRSRRETQDWQVRRSPDYGCHVGGVCWGCFGVEHPSSSTTRAEQHGSRHALRGVRSAALRGATVLRGVRVLRKVRALRGVKFGSRFSRALGGSPRSRPGARGSHGGRDLLAESGCACCQICCGVRPQALRQHLEELMWPCQSASPTALNREDRCYWRIHPAGKGLRLASRSDLVATFRHPTVLQPRDHRLKAGVLADRVKVDLDVQLEDVRKSAVESTGQGGHGPIGASAPQLSAAGS